MILVANEQRWAVLEGDLCIRVDSQGTISLTLGVDLNRNYNISFDEGSDDPNSETYHGAHAMSQPLSVCVDNLLKHNNYSLVIDIHTGEFTLFHQPNSEK